MELSMSKFVLLFICLFSTLFAEEEEIYVRLASEVEMIPVFLSPVQTKESTLSQEQLASIREVLVFDLNHNGMTRVLSSKELPKFPSLKDQTSFDGEVDFAKVKSDGILYLIKLRVQGKEMSAKLISTNAQTATTIEHVMLSGDLKADRGKMHQLADAIHKVLFGKSGIATCRILFTIKKKIDRPKQEPKWVSEVFMADYDGFNAKQLTYDDTLTANPVFVPGKPGEHASSFAYVSYKIGQPKLFLSSLNPGKSQRISGIRANQMTPSLNNTGSMIAFACDFTTRSDIFIQSMPKFGQPADKPRQIFTAKGTANASPTFSPDGKQVAFVSDKDGSPKVYVMKIPAPNTKLEQIKPQLISKRNRENSAPSWSPDGKKLAFCAKTFGERQIWIYDFETGVERQLTQGKATKENPTWAPDSLHLLFNAKDANGTDIYLINLNQPEAVKITSGSDVKLFPSWEPKAL